MPNRPGSFGAVSPSWKSFSSESDNRPEKGIRDALQIKQLIERFSCCTGKFRNTSISEKVLNSGLFYIFHFFTAF